MSDIPKLLRTTQDTSWVVHWATQDFSLAATPLHAWCDVSEWHKFVIAIVTLVFPESSDCWGTRDSKAASVDRSVTGPNYRDDEFSLSNQITNIGIYIFAKSFEIDYFADAFPYTNARHNITSKDKLGTGTSHLADMPTAVHKQNSWTITGWSYGTVSMAMYCLGYNKLTPDRSLANHVFDAAAAVAVFDTGSEEFISGFATPHHCAPLEAVPVETLPMTNVTHKLLDSGQHHMWPHPQAKTRRPRSNDV